MCKHGRQVRNRGVKNNLDPNRAMLFPSHEVKHEAGNTVVHQEFYYGRSRYMDEHEAYGSSHQWLEAGFDYISILLQ